jgi:N-methylhydantoinase B
MDPGVTLRATEIYQEGFRMGPTQLADAGRLRRDLVDLLAANSRLPKSIRGDMQAMIAACRTGERRYKALLRKFGKAEMQAATSNIFDQCEQLDRAAVAALPDGEYVADGYLDNDGHSDDPLPIKVRVVIDGSEMTIDVRGSSAQRAACVNAGLPYTVSAARLAFKFLINPELPVTGGSFRPLRVIADPGSIFAAQEPAPTQRAAPCLGLLIDLVIRALAPVMPEWATANQCADPMNVYLSGTDPRSGRRFIAGEALGIGWGGHANGDGESALINYGGGDLKNFPVETIEQRYPLKIRQFSLQPDSGGAGRRRGGLGVVREYEIRSEDADVSLWFERSVTPGLGLFGGHSGGIPEVTIDPGTPHERRLLKVNHLPVTHGTIIRAVTGGGGGYGPPAERPPELLASDLTDGYVTPDSATRDYPLS